GNFSTRPPNSSTSFRESSRDVHAISSCRRFLPGFEMIASLPREQACKMFSCAPSQRGSAIFRHRYIASGYAPREDLERVTRLELATSSLARRCSTTELHPQFTYAKRHPDYPDILALHTDFVHLA